MSKLTQKLDVLVILLEGDTMMKAGKRHSSKKWWCLQVSAVRTSHKNSQDAVVTGVSGCSLRLEI